MGQDFDKSLEELFKEPKDNKKYSEIKFDLFEIYFQALIFLNLLTKILMI